MKYCVLASGSKGNMTYIEHGQTALLIDAGISYTSAMKRSEAQNIDLHCIEHILITHEHSDHVQYVAMIAKKTRATIYIQRDSFKVLNSNVKDQLKGLTIKFIQEDSKYVFGDMEVLTLKMSHDAASCLGFVVVGGNKKVGYIVDTGFFPIKYIDIVKQLDSLIIEANHDVEMLTESNRMWHLKERILSPTGHMSNYICSQVLQTIAHNGMHSIVLAHLSEDCNTEELVHQDIIAVVKPQFKGEIFIARQKEALKMIEL
jgi:phosphoribosyl 1,2-cyclic phosphodiesterase